MIDSKIRNKNIKHIIESTDFFQSMYNNMRDYVEKGRSKENIEEEKLELLENREGTSAAIFNTIMLTAQLVDDEKDVINIAKIFLDKYKGINNTMPEIIFTDLVCTIEKHFHKKISKEEVIQALYHGCAVHFTTASLAKKIKKEGMKAYGNAITKEEIEILKDAQRKQIEKCSEKEKILLKYLFFGWEHGKGISMSSQTDGFWMNRTPESLGFLLGVVDFSNDNYEIMKEHIQSVTSHLTEEEREKVIEICNTIWERVVGDDERRSAILINRDDLQYELDLSYTPPQEKNRLYTNNSLVAIQSMENPRYCKDIPNEALDVVFVPSIKILEKKRNIELEGQVITKKDKDYNFENR